MKLKIMEWNIHQQGRQWNKTTRKSVDGEIPLWILEQIPNDINIVVFTEFNSHAKNISDFYSALSKKGFYHSSTNYSCGWSNDVLIAVRSNIIIEAVLYVKAYPDTPNTTLNIAWDTIPENLRVDIKINEKLVHLWGIRIKCLDGDYKKRKIEMETVMRWLKEVDGINILVGDFNNLRENTPEINWNLTILDELLGEKFERKTPSNYSWGVSMSQKDNSFDGFIKNDHFICSKGISLEVEPYKWNYLNKCNYSFNNNELKLCIPVREPDHAILIGEVEL